MSDNLDIYKKIIFRPPTPRHLLAAMLLLGALFGAGTTIALSPSSSIRANIIGAAVVALFFYIVPALLAAELATRLGNITRRWTYVMGIANQLTIFLFTLTLLIADSVGEAWQVMWLALATVYFIDLLMVVMANGRNRHIAVTVVLPLTAPVFLLGAFHLLIGRVVGIPSTLYLQNSFFFLASAFLLWLTVGIYTFIIQANVDMSALDFFATLISDDEQALDIGVDIDVPHQALHIDNGESMAYTVPWLHPGPIEGFGGGRLTSALIDADTFMLHIPSYHTLDLADPADIPRFRDLPEAETREEATRMHTWESGNFTLHGRRYPGGTVIYIDNKQIDDYEPSISYRLKDEHPGLCLIDLHNQPRWGNKESWVEDLDGRYGTLREGVATLMDDLADAEMHPYHAGFAGNGDYRALVEEVDGQRTCLLGIDGNDAPQVLYDLESDLDFDRTLVFTTDSHEHILELAHPRKYTRDELEAAVAEAEDDLAPASVGLGERTVENVRVLGKDYEGLIATLNIMARMVPISLVLYYIGIIFLVM